MIKFVIIIALNLAFLAWVITLIVRDPANVWKRRDRQPPADDEPGSD
ncbi:MAG: hypothetical protein H7268_06860 [Sandarakinorhabdus sp.]|nr:hypothetical protein [Sandarakinorhabdus sp.]